MPAKCYASRLKSVKAWVCGACVCMNANVFQRSVYTYVTFNFYALHLLLLETIARREISSIANWSTKKVFTQRAVCFYLAFNYPAKYDMRCRRCKIHDFFFFFNNGTQTNRIYVWEDRIIMIVCVNAAVGVSVCVCLAIKIFALYVLSFKLPKRKTKVDLF